MATERLSLNKHEVNVIERDVETVTVGVGSLVVVDTTLAKDKIAQVEADGDTYQAGGHPLALFAIEGANYSVVYTDPTGTEAPVLPREVPATTVPATERGDAGGDTGSFESRTVPELEALVEERGIAVEGTGKGGNILKADLIEALRA